MNYLLFSIQIAKRIIPASLQAVALLAIILGPALWIENPIASSAFDDYCIRWTYCVVMFFVAALVVFADRITFEKCNRITATVFALFFVHASFAIWFFYDSYGYQYDSRGSFHYAWMLGATTFGLFMWILLRKRLCVEGDKERIAPQFSIGSILVWFSIGAAFLTLIQRSSAYPVPSNFDPVTDPTWDSLAAIVTVFLLLPLITESLLRTRRFFRSAVCVWIIIFAGSWVVFCLIGLGETAYDVRDQYIVKIAAFSYASLLYLVWLAVMKRFLVRCQVRWRTDDDRSAGSSWIPTKPLAILATILWIYAALWLVLNVAVPTPKRHASWIDHSPEIIQGFEDAWGSQLIDELERTHSPETIPEWINCLGRHEVPKEKDVLFQIACLARLSNLDGAEGNWRVRKAMGFTQQQIDGLPEESFDGWITDLFQKGFHIDRLASIRFIETRKQTFQEIRDAIARSEGACNVLVDDFPPTLNVISRFAFNLSLIHI